MFSGMRANQCSVMKLLPCLFNTAAWGAPVEGFVRVSYSNKDLR